MIKPFTLLTIGKNIINKAHAEGIELRLFGGVGVRACCGSDNPLYMQRRGSPDIDFVCNINQIDKVSRLLRNMAIRPVTAPGYQRKCEYQTFTFESGTDLVRLDIYYGNLEFNHLIPPPYILPAPRYTIPVTQLFLSKLAIVELVEKDAIDILLLLLKYDFVNGDLSGIDKAVLLNVFTKGIKGWGLAKTCFENLRKIQIHAEMFVKDIPDRNKLFNKLEVLKLLIADSKKSPLWKLRSLVGVNYRWYNIIRPREN